MNVRIQILGTLALAAWLTACGGGGGGGTTQQAPQITTQPMAQTGIMGEQVQFTVAASGSPTPTISWTLDGAALVDGPLASGRCAGATVAGATTATLALSALPDACDGAVLRAQAANSAGSAALSNPVVLTVETRPQVLAAPANIRVNAPASASFSVQAGGRPAPTVQWQLSTDGGQSWTDIAGAAALQYTIDSTSPADNGKRLRAMLTNRNGSTASNAAQLTVDAITPATLTLLAGNVGGFGSWDGTGAAARFNRPIAVARDAAGNVYVADQNNNTIRKITALGVVTTLAGAAGEAGSSDGPGDQARFNFPNALAVDSAGNVFVADMANHTIRRIASDGTVSTLAGSAGQSGSADGSGAAARFSSPSGLAFDAGGRLIVADADNHTLRAINAAGVVSTLSGVAGEAGSTDGPAGTARLNYPGALALASDGVLYVSDSGNYTLRRVDADGTLTTVAGAPGQSGLLDGNGSNARLGGVRGLAADSGGGLWLSESAAGTLRRYTSGGNVTTVVDYPTLGSGDAPRFNSPSGLAPDGSGGVLVADVNNHVIRTVSAAAVVGTLAGTAALTGNADGVGSAARFTAPRGLAVDASGNVVVADAMNATVRRIASNGTVSTVAASPNLASPASVAIDNSGNIYVADTGAHVIRKITPGGTVTVLAGTPGQSGSADGVGAAARFYIPYGVAVDAAGVVYVADTANQLVRRIAPDGTVTTLAGTARASGSADGVGAAARFYNPYGVAVDAAGVVYVADTANQTVRRILPDGTVSTLAGLAGSRGSSDGAGATARFGNPSGLALDGAGNLYVADTGNGTVRRVTPAGVVSTVVGAPGRGGVRLGADGRLVDPAGVVVLGPNQLAISTAAGVVLALVP